MTSTFPKMLARTLRLASVHSAIYRQCFSTAARQQIPADASVYTSTSNPMQVIKVVPNTYSKSAIDRSQAPLSLEIPVCQPTDEPYTVTRTPSKGLPVYELRKGGGTLKLTRVRKVGGERNTLKRQLEEMLIPKPEYVKINPRTGHIVVKGLYKGQIEEILKEKGF